MLFLYCRTVISDKGFLGATVNYLPNRSQVRTVESATDRGGFRGTKEGSPFTEKLYCTYKAKLNPFFTSVYYILNLLSITPKHSSLVKGVQNLYEVVGSISTGHSLF